MLGRVILAIGSIAMMLLAGAGMFGFRMFLNAQSNDFIYGFGCGGLFVGLMIYAIWKLDPLSFISTKKKIEIALRRGDYALVAQFEAEAAERKKAVRRLFIVLVSVIAIVACLKGLESFGFMPEHHRAGANSLPR